MARRGGDEGEESETGGVRWERVTEMGGAPGGGDDVCAAVMCGCCAVLMWYCGAEPCGATALVYWTG